MKECELSGLSRRKRKLKLLKTVALTGFFAAIGIMPASASTITAFGSFSFGALKATYTTTTPGGSLYNADTIKITLPIQIGGAEDTYLGQPNVFCSPSMDCTGNGTTPLQTGDTMTILDNTLTLNPLELPTFTFSSSTTPAQRFTFTATKGTITRSKNGVASGIELGYYGTFTDSEGTYAPGAAYLSMSFSQSSPTASFGMTGSFSTPPERTEVPEPATMALAGGALLGIAVLGRRRTAKQ